MIFKTYREAVAALFPEQRADWLFVGLGQLIAEPESGCIVVTTTTVLGSASEGYSHAHRIQYYRPVGELHWPEDAMTQLPATARVLGISPTDLRVLRTGMSAQGSEFELTTAPDGTGFNLMLD